MEETDKRGYDMNVDIWLSVVPYLSADNVAFQLLKG